MSTNKIKRQRNEKISRRQKEELVSFMEQHSDLSSGRIVGSQARLKATIGWTELTIKLNKLGTVKSMAKWQKAWSDIKDKAKKKVGAIKQGKNQVMCSMEDRILNLITSKGVKPNGLDEADSSEISDITGSKDVELLEIKVEDERNFIPEDTEILMERSVEEAKVPGINAALNYEFVNTQLLASKVANDSETKNRQLGSCQLLNRHSKLFEEQNNCLSSSGVVYNQLPTEIPRSHLPLPSIAITSEVTPPISQNSTKQMPGVESNTIEASQTEQILGAIAKIGDNLNSTLLKVAENLNLILNERKRTNSLLEELTDVLKQ